MIGVTVAQLFRLQHSPYPNSVFGFYVLGKPLACICQGCAIYFLLLGAYRSWRHQHAIVRGKALAGGLEVFLMGTGVLMVSTVRPSITYLPWLIRPTDMRSVLCPTDCCGY